jgi:hypothetical protein
LSISGIKSAKIECYIPKKIFKERLSNKYASARNAVSALIAEKNQNPLHEMCSFIQIEGPILRGIETVPSIVVLKKNCLERILQIAR